MKRLHPIIAILLLAAGCGTDPEQPTKASPSSVETAKPGGIALVSQPPTTAAEAQEQVCTRLTFEGTLLTHCTADPKRHRIVTVLGRSGGAPFRGLGGLAEARTERLPEVAFAMNGGMFDDHGQPIGYYVENGRRLTKLNRNGGLGNFHLMPNGVFYGTGQDWAVRSTDWFADNVENRPDFATQSGPMLVIDGELHPKFDDDGPSRNIRNAVGVDEQGRAHFVISEQPLSFGRLARFYRDELRVANALYLDGNVSSLWYPKGARIDASPPLGPLILVEKKPKAAAKPGSPTKPGARNAE